MYLINNSSATEMTIGPMIPFGGNNSPLGEYQPSNGTCNEYVDI